MLIERAGDADVEAASHFDAPAKRFRGAFWPDCRLFCPFRAQVSRSSRMMRVPQAPQAAHAHQVVGGKARQRLPRASAKVSGDLLRARLTEPMEAGQILNRQAQG